MYNSRHTSSSSSPFFIGQNMRKENERHAAKCAAIEENHYAAKEKSSFILLISFPMPNFLVASHVCGM